MYCPYEAWADGKKNAFLWTVCIKNKWLKEGGIMFILI